LLAKHHSASLKQVRFSLGALASIPLAMSMVTAPAQATEPAQAGGATTTITMNFVGNGCVGCEITPQSLLLSEPNSAYDPDGKAVPYVVGRDNTVTFDVPTEATRGMSFVINDPSKADPDYLADFVTLIAMQYKGVEPGKRVSSKRAKRGKSASPCWSGTNASDVRMKVKVRNRKVEGLPVNGASGTKKIDLPLAWVVPTKKAFGGFSRTDRGLIGAQDVYPCGPRSD